MKWILKCIGAVILFVLLAFALAWATMLLWNWLIPSLFGGPIITYLEAAGLMILGRLLIGGFGGGKGGRCGSNNCESGGGWRHGKRGSWKQRWEAKMEGMSEEEKQKFMAGMNKCGWGKEKSVESEQGQ